MTWSTQARLTLPGAWLGVTLYGCQAETPPEPGIGRAEAFGDSSAEQVFQQAEVLRFSLDQARLEQQRLRSLQTNIADSDSDTNAVPDDKTEPASTQDDRRPRP
jgi:hypothetical protein